MDITLEKIELVKDRTGVGYREAREALEKTEGSVVDAIILIEDSIDKPADSGEKKSSEILDAVKEAVRKGNVSRVVIKKGEETIMNLPVNIGIIGTVLFPWAAIGGCIAALGTKCSVEIVGEDGSAISISEKATAAFETVKDKGSVLYDEVRDKGGDLFEAAKDKGSDLYEAAKDKGEDLYEAAKDKGSDLYEAAKNKASESFGKNRGAEAEVFTKDNDFDLSDLDLDGMEEDK